MPCRVLLCKKREMPRRGVRSQAVKYHREWRSCGLPPTAMGVPLRILLRQQRTQSGPRCPLGPPLVSRISVDLLFNQYGHGGNNDRDAVSEYIYGTPVQITQAGPIYRMRMPVKQILSKLYLRIDQMTHFLNIIYLYHLFIRQLSLHNLTDWTENVYVVSMKTEQYVCKYSQYLVTHGPTPI